ncbi:MAG: hypothetical protein SFY80_06270 [Verrucomicrobiota bacterium]|nr:hypothetical protein [Verrucomicrobiota bacterium]
MKMLLFVSVIAILVCLGVVVIAIMVDRRRNSPPADKVIRKQDWYRDK